MLSTSHVDFFLEIDPDALGHLLPSPELRHSIVLCRSGHRLLSFGRLLLIKHGGLGGGTLLAPSSLGQVPLSFLSLTILLGFKELFAIVAELRGQDFPLLLVAHDLGTSMVRNHLQSLLSLLEGALLLSLLRISQRSVLIDLLGLLHIHDVTELGLREHDS